MTGKYSITSLIAIILIASVLILSGCGQLGQNGNVTHVKDGCRYPVHNLKVSVSPARCKQLSESCEKFKIIASSPQIASYIASGKIPCSSGGGDKGCGVYSVGSGWSRLFCLDPSECLKGASANAMENFGGAITDSSIKITDTVSYCAYTEDDKPLGTCVSSLVDQCNPDATLTLLIN